MVVVTLLDLQLISSDLIMLRENRDRRGSVQMSASPEEKPDGDNISTVHAVALWPAAGEG